MKKGKIVSAILKKKGFSQTIKDKAQAFASVNIALCKYWGKRDDELNLPVTSSLSISLGNLGTTTTLILNKKSDEVFLNNHGVDVNTPFFERIHDFLELFRPEPDIFFSIHTENTIPTAAGLASSASGFAALTLALNKLFSWNLRQQDLSILARLGSGSACRSIYSGFVEWHAGSSESGLDSFAIPLPNRWPEFRIGILEVSREKKNISSRQAMAQTVKTSDLYSLWPKKVKADLIQIKKAIATENFSLLGRIAESNALSMHATMLGAWPPVLYWLPETVDLFHKIWRMRERGLQVYFTIDAGPNIKLLFLQSDTETLKNRFPKLKIISPFANE